MPTLFWMLAYIHLNSQQQLFIDEIARCSNSTAHDSKIDISDIDFSKLLSSTLLNSGLKETLRLQGHNISPRNLREDTWIKIHGKEYLLKKGSLAFAPSSLLNLNPDIYEEPEKWKADSFVEKDTANDYIGQEQKTKIDAKNLKIPLLIWGGGSHMVRRYTSLFNLCVVSRSSIRD